MMSRTKAILVGSALIALLTASPAAANEYKKWLEQEVTWISSEAEREQFKSLDSDEARDEFIRKFWQRRDPTPATERNEYKEEHYRRLAYASKAFREGIPGWKTDRGRVYIIHGPPDGHYFFNSRSTISPNRVIAHTERNPNTILWVYHGNRYARYYRGEIRLVFQPSTGLSRADFALSESLTAQEKADEMSRRFFPASDPNWLEADVRYRLVMAGPPRLINARGAELPTAGAGEFSRYLDDLFRSPGELLEEFEKERERREAAREELRQQVSTAVSFGDLDFNITLQSFHREQADQLLPVSIEIERSDLKGPVDIYAGLITPDGLVFDEFIDSVVLDEEGRDDGQRLLYHNSFSIPADRYQLRVAVRDNGSRRQGIRQANVDLPVDRPEKTSLGGVRLTSRIAMLPEDEAVPPAVGDEIIFNGMRLLSTPNQTFAQGGVLVLFSQIWIAEPESEITLQGKFIRDGEIFRKLDTRKVEIDDRPFVEVGSIVPLTDFEPGSYTLQLQVMDHTRRTFDIRRIPLRVVTPLGEQ